MLSSQTKDEVTDAAVTKLRTAIGGTLSIENLIAADEKVIAEAINKVGFWRRKTELVPTLPLRQTSLINLNSSAI
jgi:endonuclease-3